MVLSVLQASPINSNTVRVFFNQEPRHQSRLSAGKDSLLRANWTITITAGPGEAPAVERVENATAQPNFDVAFPDAWSVDVRTDIRLLLGTTYQIDAATSIEGVDGILIAATTAGFPGIIEVRPLRPARTSRTRTGIDFANNPFTGRYQIDGRGDYETHGGNVALRKRLIRRVTSARGAFRHLPEYGLGLVSKRLLTTTSRAELQVDARRQVLLESDVQKARAEVLTSQPGVVVLKVWAQPRQGPDVNITFEVPDDGPILVGT